jgi:hypothetical protein
MSAYPEQPKVKRNVPRKPNEAKAAFGFNAHSGWAALIVLGRRHGDLQVLERSRVDLVEEEWAKQPYHAAEELKPAEARKVVKRGIDAATRIALREMRSAVKRTRESGFEVRDCGLLVGSPMPDWSVDQILAVHFRMHKAEGVLFRDVLAKAADGCDLRLVAIPEKSLFEHAEAALKTSATTLSQQIAALGKSVGAPWTKDQKEATLAAMIALHKRGPGQ